MQKELATVISSENPVKQENVQDYQVLPTSHSQKLHHIFAAHTHIFWNLYCAL